MNHRILNTRTRGFTLLELLLSLALFSIVMIGVFTLITGLQKSYEASQSRIDAEAQARSALSLIAAEFEMAGSNPTVDTVLTAAVNACANPCTVAVRSGAGLNLNDRVSIGAGASYEVVTVTAVGNGYFQAALGKSHVAGEPVVYPGYPYNTGIYYPNCGAVSCTDTKLQIFGNLLGDGKIYFVEYKYDATNHWITRSETPITAASKNPAYVVCENVQGANFTVYQDSQLNYSSASFSVTVQTPYKNPQTNQYQTVSVQRGVIQARNVGLATMMMANGNASNVTPTPAGAATLSP